MGTPRTNDGTIRVKCPCCLHVVKGSLLTIEFLVLKGLQCDCRPGRVLTKRPDDGSGKAQFAFILRT